MTVGATASRPAVVFVVGAARSGTSLLYRALCLHPDVTYVSNYVRRLPMAPVVGVLNRAPRRWPKLRRGAWFGEDGQAYVYAERRGLLDRLVPQPVEGEPFFSYCGFRQYDWEPAGDTARQARLLNRSLRTISWSAGASLVVSKRIAHNRRVGELHRAVPHAHFLIVSRDGRATARSLAGVDWWLDDKLWWEGSTPRQLEAAGADPWEICARNWVEDVKAVEAGVATLPPESVHRVRYEELAADPEGVVGGLAASLGLSRDDPWLASLRDLRSAVRSPRPSLPADIAARIESVQKEMLAHYGYLD